MSEFFTVLETGYVLIGNILRDSALSPYGCKTPIGLVEDLVSQTVMIGKFPAKQDDFRLKRCRNVLNLRRFWLYLRK